MNTGPGKLPSLCSLHETSTQTHHSSRIITFQQSATVSRRESSWNWSNLPSATVLHPHLVQHHCSLFTATLCTSNMSPTIKQPSFLGKPPACVSGSVPLMMHDWAPPHFSLAALQFLTCAYPAWWLGRGRPSVWPLLSLLNVQKKSVIKNCPQNILPWGVIQPQHSEISPKDGISRPVSICKISILSVWDT